MTFIIWPSSHRMAVWIPSSCKIQPHLNSLGSRKQCPETFSSSRTLSAKFYVLCSSQKELIISLATGIVQLRPEIWQYVFEFLSKFYTQSIAQLALWNSLSLMAELKQSLFELWQSGVEDWKILTVGPCFQVFLTIHGPSSFCDFAQRLYNSYNHAQAPGQNMWLSLDLRPYSNLKCSKTVEVRCSS